MNYKKITSTSHDLIKQIVQLHNPKNRSKFQHFIAEGVCTISTIIKAGNKPLLLAATEELLADAKRLAHTRSIILVAQNVMDKISTATTPSGLLAVFRIPIQPSLDTLDTGIVLAKIADPGNMGTLIRTAAAMNKKSIVCIDTVDPWNPKVVQATAGAIGIVSIFCITWQELLLHKKNIPLYALVAKKGKNPNTVNMRNGLIVIGSESHGIPDEWVAQCDKKITLPMPGNFESLNAAVAGSIALYLAATQ